MRLAGAQSERYNCFQFLPVEDRAMKYLRRLAWAGATCLLLSAAGASSTAAQKPDKDKDSPDAQRPKVSLKAQPMIAISPARVVLTAELSGGSNDYEDYYCPTVVWAWGDGTESENSTDCAPYEAGKSEIKRRFTVEHIFRRADMYRVTFRLKRHDKAVAFATVNVQVRPGLREGGQ
jgi:hypothetical protein